MELVDIEDTPIEAITPHGIRTTDTECEFDVIVSATGFDAVTGAFDRIRITGSEGRLLSDAWADGPITYLGVLMHGFPNMAMIACPQGASSTINFPRSIELTVDWITDLLQYVSDHGIGRFEDSAEAQAEWGAEVHRFDERMLLRHAKSWFTGYNENVEGRQRTRYVMYNGGLPRYRSRVEEVAAAGYPTLTMTPVDSPVNA